MSPVDNSCALEAGSQPPELAGSSDDCGKERPARDGRIGAAPAQDFAWV